MPLLVLLVEEAAVKMKRVPMAVAVLGMPKAFLQSPLVKP
jgi:hypothetical protein